MARTVSRCFSTSRCMFETKGLLDQELRRRGKKKLEGPVSYFHDIEGSLYRVQQLEESAR